MAVSDKPWSNFSQADYSIDQWKRACVVDTGQGDPSSKQRYKVPVREPDGTLNRNGVHAAAGGHGISQVQGISPSARKTAARKLVDFYENDLKEEPPPSLETLAGVNEREDQAEDAKETQRSMVRRVWPLDGIEILSRAKGGDGRTVEAYAAVFNVQQEVNDQHGHYIEENDPNVFRRSINNGAAMRAQVLYNHGFDARGKSGGLPTLPIGHPVDISADNRGLLTVTRYNKSQFADMVLESIKNGDITAQSYEGPIYRSNPTKVPRVRPGQSLPVVRRMEMGLRNYGPTPTPYYQDAKIVAVRSAQELFDDFESLAEDQRHELIRMLSATPNLGLGTEDSREAHSGRQRLLRIRAEASFVGVL